MDGEGGEEKGRKLNGVGKGSGGREEGHLIHSGGRRESQRNFLRRYCSIRLLKDM